MFSDCAIRDGIADDSDLGTFASVGSQGVAAATGTAIAGATSPRKGRSTVTRGKGQGMGERRRL